MTTYRVTIEAKGLRSAGFSPRTVDVEAASRADAILAATESLREDGYETRDLCSCEPVGDPRRPDGRGGRMSQSRMGSVAETCASTAIGYVVAFSAQVVVFPWFGIHVRLSDNAAIGIIFTAISLARGYLVRRLFNRWHS